MFFVHYFLCGGWNYLLHSLTHRKPQPRSPDDKPVGRLPWAMRVDRDPGFRDLRYIDILLDKFSLLYFLSLSQFILTLDSTGWFKFDHHHCSHPLRWLSKVSFVAVDSRMGCMDIRPLANGMGTRDEGVTRCDTIKREQINTLQWSDYLVIHLTCSANSFSHRVNAGWTATVRVYWPEERREITRANIDLWFLWNQTIFPLIDSCSFRVLKMYDWLFSLLVLSAGRARYLSRWADVPILALIQCR